MSTVFEKYAIDNIISLQFKLYQQVRQKSLRAYCPNNTVPVSVFWVENAGRRGCKQRFSQSASWLGCSNQFQSQQSRIKGKKQCYIHFHSLKCERSCTRTFRKYPQKSESRLAPFHSGLQIFTKITLLVCHFLKFFQ